ncbi:MAG: CHAT domain-containing tetratricopeptide repeat protein [Bacteroidota bacterium]
MRLTLSLLGLYAELLRYQQNYQEAKSLLRRLLPETQKRQGKSHATTVRMILKLAQIEADDNQYPIAKNLLARAEKQIDKKAHDSEDLNLDCRQLRVQLALYQGQHEQGLEQLSQMIASPKKKLSPSVLVGIQFQSALIYTQSQQWAAAQKAFANCLVYYESRSRHHLPYMSERGQWQLHTEWQLFLRAYLSFLLLPQNALPDRLSLAFQLRLDYKDYVMRFRRHYQPLMISNQSVDSKALWEEWQDSQLTLHRAMLVPEERLEQEGQFLHVLANVTDQKERLWRNSLQDQLPSYEIPKLPWQSLGQKLKKGEALLEIVANPIYGDKTDLGSKMGAFVLRYDQPDRLQYQAFREAEELLEKGEAKILASLFPQDERLRNLYFESLEEQIDPSELYHLFWRDIAPLLQGIERVYFSPDGPFHQLNPAMLSHKKGEYLEDTVEFVHLRHLHDWVKPTEVDKAPKQACIFANPDFALHPQKKAALLYQKGLASAEIGPNVKIVRRLSRLPGTLNEASQIVDLMSAKGIECRLFTEEHALEAEVHRQTKVDVLHFATHGYFDHESKREKRGSALGLNEAGLTEFPFYGAGLFLAGANYGIDESYNGQLNDGILFADEVSKMDLSAVQLVVLSACQTGQGEIAPGEGIFSLHTAFLQAGAQAVLFSLWEVGDTVSALFMTHFYKCWLGGKSKRLALCEARQYIKAQYPEPRDWAAFVLVEA